MSYLRPKDNGLAAGFWFAQWLVACTTVIWVLSKVVPQHSWFGAFMTSAGFGGVATVIGALLALNGVMANRQAEDDRQSQARERESKTRKQERKKQLYQTQWDQLQWAINLHLRAADPDDATSSDYQSVANKFVTRIASTGSDEGLRQAADALLAVTVQSPPEEDTFDVAYELDLLAYDLAKRLENVDYTDFETVREVLDEFPAMVAMMAERAGWRPATREE